MDDDRLGTSAYNDIRAALDFDRGTNLIHSISEDRQIVATLKYGDGTIDILKFEGFRDTRKFGGGKNSPFEECLRGLTPRVSKYNMRPLP